jgi:hypothetical protein
MLTLRLLHQNGTPRHSHTMTEAQRVCVKVLFLYMHDYHFAPSCHATGQKKGTRYFFTARRRYFQLQLVQVTLLHDTMHVLINQLRLFLQDVQLFLQLPLVSQQFALVELQFIVQELDSWTTHGSRGVSSRNGSSGWR